MSTKPRDSESAVERFSRESTADLLGQPLERPRVRDLTGTSGNERRLVRVFISYVRDDEGARAIELRGRLQQRFQGHLRYDVRFWIDRDLNLEKWNPQIERELESCDFGLLLISPAFATRPYISVTELPVFRDRGKPFSAVGFRPVDKTQDNLGGLDAEQFFRLDIKGRPRSYCELTPVPQRQEFVEALFKKLTQRFDALWGDARQSDESREAADEQRPWEGNDAWQGRDEDFRQLVGKMPQHLQRTKAARTYWAAIESMELPRRGAGLDALDELANWACDDKSPPFCAVLGEYGMGKTTTLKWLTQELLDRRSRGERVPLPIYIDLCIGTDDVGRVPTLEELLTEHVRRNHKLTQSRIAVAEIIKLVREQGALMIFDGLDEKLVHLQPKFARDFVRELWKALPPVERYRGRDESGARRLGKLLISCRSHFFRNLQEQQGCFLGQDREGLRAGKPLGNDATGGASTDEGDYRLFVVLPFDETQVRSYLKSAMGSESRADEALALIRRVHNLTELTERPVLLAHLTDHLLDLEQAAARGETINAAAVYERVVERWFIRDNGKHQLNPEHKRRLMQALAAKLHSEGRSELEVDRLEHWLDEFLASHKVIADAYAGRSRDVLKEDLRVATFLVRPESGANSHLFRFAHQSLLEFFLAKHLLDALVEKDTEAWSIPAPSRETLEFLVQMLLRRTAYERDLALRTWSSLLESGGRSALTALRAWIAARAIDAPEPAPEHLSLDDVNLQGFQLLGTQDRPWILRNASFQRAKLMRTRWRFVEFIGANFKGAYLEQSSFDRCVLDDASFDGALLQGMFVRVGSAGGVDLRSAVNEGHGSEWLMGGRDAPANIGDATQIEFGACAGTGILVPVNTVAENVSACAFAPDGQRIVSGHKQGLVQIWDVVSARSLLSLQGHIGEVVACAFAPDGRSVLSASADELRLWNVVTGECMHELGELGNSVLNCAYSPDGRYVLALLWLGEVVLWNCRTHDYLALQDFTAASCFAFSPDGATLLCGSAEGELGLWDCDNGKRICAFPREDKALVACFFADHGRVVHCVLADQTIRSWDANTRRLLGGLRRCGKRNATDIAVAPGGRLILNGSNWRESAVWDVVSGQRTQAFSDVDVSVAVCAFAPDGKAVLSKAVDDGLRLWDVATGRCSRVFSGGTSYIRGSLRFAFEPDGHSVVSEASGAKLWRWDVQTGERVQAQAKGVSDLFAAKTEGKIALSTELGGMLHLEDKATGQRIRTFGGSGDYILDASLSHDEQMVLSGSLGGTLRLWSVATGICLRVFHHLPNDQYASFCPGRPTPIAASSDAWRHFHAHIDRGEDYPLVLPAEALTDLWPDTDAETSVGIDH